jgi:hypothetical protein
MARLAGTALRKGERAGPLPREGRGGWAPPGSIGIEVDRGACVGARSGTAAPTASTIRFPERISWHRMLLEAASMTPLRSRVSARRAPAVLGVLCALPLLGVL